MPHDGKLITALLVSDVAVIPKKAQGPVAESQHLIYNVALGYLIWHQCVQILNQRS